MTSFDSLPLDILLGVFQELDAVDLIHLGMVSSSLLSPAPGDHEFPFETEQVCKDLHHIAQDREVWADQLEKLRQEHPSLKPATPPLSSLSVQELQTFVMGQAKLRRRFNEGYKNLGFTAEGVTEIPGRCTIMLLPGGRSLLAVNSKGGNMTLHRIRLEDGQASLPVAARINVGERVSDGILWKRLLTATSPCPVLIRLGTDQCVRHSSFPSTLPYRDISQGTTYRFDYQD
jgi:hypothetical protein